MNEIHFGGDTLERERDTTRRCPEEALEMTRCTDMSWERHTDDGCNSFGLRFFETTVRWSVEEKSDKNTSIMFAPSQLQSLVHFVA